MNAHLVQSPLAQSEARLIMSAELQYISGTDGGVLRGLIQDHVDGKIIVLLIFFLHCIIEIFLQYNFKSWSKVNASIHLFDEITVSAICICGIGRRIGRRRRNCM